MYDKTDQMLAAELNNKLYSPVCAKAFHPGLCLKLDNLSASCLENWQDTLNSPKQQCKLASMQANLGHQLHAVATLEDSASIC